MTLFPTQPNIPSPTTAARPVTVPAPGVSAPLGADDAKRARILADAIRARFAQTLVGQDNLRESLIVTLVAGGHILIESVPGLAKTTAAQTLATCVSGSFKRVQCTPDLMPSDLVGTQVFDFASQKFTHINMAITGAGLDDRDRTVFHDSADQPCASAWNQHIHILPQPHKACSRLMICHFDQLESVLSHTSRRQRFFQY